MNDKSNISRTRVMLFVGTGAELGDEFKTTDLEADKYYFFVWVEDQDHYDISRPFDTEQEAEAALEEMMSQWKTLLKQVRQPN